MLTCNRGARRSLACALAALTIVASGGVSAAPISPQRKCAAALLGAAGGFETCLFKAQAKFIAKGDVATHDRAVAACGTKFAAAGGKAVGRYGTACPLRLPPADVASLPSILADLFAPPVWAQSAVDQSKSTVTAGMAATLLGSTDTVTSSLVNINPNAFPTDLTGAVIPNGSPSPDNYTLYAYDANHNPLAVSNGVLEWEMKTQSNYQDDYVVSASSLGPPIAFSPDVSQGFASHPGDQGTVGYVLGLKVGSTTLPADFNVQTPAGTTVAVVGVISAYSWSGIPTDPMTVSFQVSAANRGQILTLTHANLSNASVTFNFQILQYDSQAQLFFVALTPQAGAALTSAFVMNGATPDFSVDANPGQVQSPVNYRASMVVRPTTTSQNLVSSSSSAGSTVVKAWSNAPNSAFAYVASLNAATYAGHQDWRLPADAELDQIVRAPCTTSVCLYPQLGIFAGVGNGVGYVSTTPADSTSGLVETVNFAGGAFLHTPASHGFVRAVRTDAAPHSLAIAQTCLSNEQCKSGFCTSGVCRCKSATYAIGGIGIPVANQWIPTPGGGSDPSDPSECAVVVQLAGGPMTATCTTAGIQPDKILLVQGYSECHGFGDNAGCSVPWCPGDTPGQCCVGAAGPYPQCLQPNNYYPEPGAQRWVVQCSS